MGQQIGGQAFQPMALIGERGEAALIVGSELRRGVFEQQLAVGSHPPQRLLQIVSGNRRKFIKRGVCLGELSNLVGELPIGSHQIRQIRLT